MTLNQCQSEWGLLVLRDSYLYRVEIVRCQLTCAYINIRLIVRAYCN